MQTESSDKKDMTLTNISGKWKKSAPQIEDKSDDEKIPSPYQLYAINLECILVCRLNDCNHMQQ
jgi:hypothetical protein